MRRLERTLAVAALVTGCASAPPAQYVAHADAAQAATRRGAHLEAADQWNKAAVAAASARDRQEALYRQATSYQRAGETERYLRLLSLLSTSPGPRQERAAYDLASHALERDTKEGAATVRETLLRFPASGLARGALDRWMATLSPGERLVELAALERRVREPSLREHLLMAQAQNLELLERNEAALAAYRQVVSQFPYPVGRYWDIATLRIAVLSLQKGDADGAVAALRDMLSHREKAALVGSYERHYSEASLLLAYCLLDRDWREAHRVLQTFPAEYPDSRERDDAMWAAGLLAQQHGMPEEACQSVRGLRADTPESRYVGCAEQLCPDVDGSPSCHAYILRDRASAEATLRAVLDRHLEQRRP